MTTKGQLQRLRWGLISGAVLGMMTAENVVASLFAQRAAFWDVVFLPPALFGIGFVCGWMACCLRKLSDWFGWAGSFAIGAATFTLYCAACACLDSDGLWLAVIGGLLLVLSVVLCALRTAASMLFGFGWDWRYHDRLGPCGRGHQLSESDSAERLCFDDDEIGL